MIVLIAACLPAFILAAMLWREVWTLKQPKAGMFALSIPVAAALGTLFYFVGTSTSTSFAEVWSYKISSVNYYEFWNERVSCRHPIYETRYRTVTRTRTDSKGRTQTYTEQESYQVIVGYYHPYDVDDHPAHWEAADQYGNEHDISQADYEKWKSLWQNSHWVDLHRSYHTVNGNLWKSDWPGDFQRIYPWSEIHSYENRVRVCRSVFNSARADAEAKQKYPRPADRGDTGVIHAYGATTSPDAELLYRRVNADLGPTYKVHSLVMLFDASQYGQGEIERIKAAWQGPNKNELVVCIGLTTGEKIVWCDVFSWMDDTTIHSLIRQDISNLGTYSAEKTAEILRARIPTNWKKKNFHDFDYLSVSCPTWAHVTTYATVLIGALAWAWCIERKMEWCHP